MSSTNKNFYLARCISTWDDIKAPNEHYKFGLFSSKILAENYIKRSGGDGVVIWKIDELTLDEYASEMEKAFQKNTWY